jgi:hypothetical protein
MEIGKEQRVVHVAPEPFPMGKPEDAPKEAPVPLTPELEPVPV